MPDCPAVVEIWMARLEPAPVDIGVCNDDERARAARFRAPGAGDRWLAARAVLRSVVGRAIGADAEAVMFSAAPSGKPGLSPDGPVQFNLSHSRGVVAVAVAGQPVGVDVEVRRRLVRPDRLARRLFDADRCLRWSGIDEPARTTELLQAWTRAEALLKATGEGIRGTMSGVEPRLAALGWTVRDLELGADLVGAVAAAGDQWTVGAPSWLD
jgi:4'-phosphopantetheinyl transferase